MIPRHESIGEGVLSPTEPVRKSSWIGVPLYSFTVTVADSRQGSEATFKQIAAQIQKLTARGGFR